MYQPKLCGANVDIGFAVDSSLGKKINFESAKVFVKHVAERFQISPSKSQAGFIRFGATADMSIKLNAYSSVESFRDAVDSISTTEDTTRIDQALDKAYKDLFSRTNGARYSQPQVLVLLTDNLQLKGSESQAIANSMKPFAESGIAVIVVGIGKSSKPIQLSSLLADKTDAYLVDDFQKLNDVRFIDQITHRICRATRMSI